MTAVTIIILLKNYRNTCGMALSGKKDISVDLRGFAGYIPDLNDFM